MGREVTKDIAVQHKKHAIRKMNNVFEAFINNPDDKYLKKADLLAYWLENFSDYLLEEQKFDYSKIRYNSSSSFFRTRRRHLSERHLFRE